MARQYLAVADKANAGIARVNAELIQDQTIAQFQASYSEFAQVNHEFAADLRSITFPASMGKDVDSLLAAITHTEDVARQMSRAQSAPAINGLSHQLASALVEQQAGIDNLRSDLGLPRARQSAKPTASPTASP